MAFIASNGLTEEETSRRIVVDGIDIHYHDIGHGEPILFLHSYGVGTTAWITWYKVVAEFAKDYRCILYDMPNFAKTGPVIYENESIHGFQAKVAIKLLDGLGIDSAYWVGNSQGGQSSLAAAIEYPERVRKFVMGGSHGFLGKELLADSFSEGQRARNDVMADPTKNNFLRYLKLHLYDQGLVTDELVDYLHHWYTYSPEFDEARKKSKTVGSHLGPNDVMGVRAPALIVQGRFDRVVPVEVAIALVNHIPHGRMLLFHDCCHWAPFELPDEYFSYVSAFLKQPIRNEM